MQEYQQILLSLITPNPLNPRKTFSGEEFDELVASIKQNGVLQPILTRPKDNGFEIIAGERRYRACLQIANANGGPDKNVIPAVVKELTDEQAFDLMMIENIIREDLSEFEEAQGFHQYLKGKDDSALEQLAQRTGFNPGYIRRRAAVMDLPKKYLNAWKKGDLSYGHLEVFIRIKDKEQLEELFTKAVDYKWSVKNLKDQLNNRAPMLKSALFDKKTAGCATCFYNSSKQKQLFALQDEDRLKCHKAQCFLDNTKKHLDANWAKTEWAKKFKTNGYRFDHEVSWEDFESMYQLLDADCKSCEKFITILYIGSGQSRQDKACLDRNCYKRKKAAAKTPNKPVKIDPNAPRVAWHGEYFREKFYETAIPEKFETIKPDSPVAARMAVLCLVKAIPELRLCYCQKTGIKKAEIEKGGYLSLTDEEAFAAIAKMTTKSLNTLIKELSVEAIKLKNFSATGRRIVADHIGIDLQKQWRPDEEYLSKKTKAELLNIGKSFKVFKQPKVEKYVKDKHPNKGVTGIKKTELIDVFLKSGADLSGVVPKEILN